MGTQSVLRERLVTREESPRLLVRTSCQDLKGKILLKAKKIGSLEDSFSGVVEDSQSVEVSDEDEVAEIDEDNHHHESIRRRVKVGQTVGCSQFIRFVQGSCGPISCSHNRDYLLLD